MSRSRSSHRLWCVVFSLLTLAACGGGGTEVDDGGETPASVRITAPTAPAIGDTLRLSAVAVNRGGRQLASAPVTLSVRGSAVRLVGDGLALAVDTGVVTIVGVTGSVRGEQAVTIGTPATLAVRFTAPDSLNVGDSTLVVAVEVRRENVVRTDLAARFTSSDTSILSADVFARGVVLRPLRAGQVTLTASLGARTLVQTVRVLPPRLLSVAFTPTPTVADVGDTVGLTLVAFDALGAAVTQQEAQFSVVSGPGRLVNADNVEATGPGRVVLRVAVRDRVLFDTVEVMPPSQFTITLRPGVSADGTVSTIPPRLQRALDRAVKRWRQVLRDDLPLAPLQLAANTCRNPAINESVNGVLVHVRVPPLGFGGVLAQATACVLRSDGRTIHGFMEFNSDVLDRLGDLELFYTAAHELGHVLGIGTSWYRATGFPSLVSTSGTTNIFVGPQAIAAFNLLENRGSYTGPVIPLAPDRGHWNPNILRNELMEPFARITTRFSRLTVGAMADMGYVVNPRSWDRYAMPLPAFSSSASARAFDLQGDVLPPFGVVMPDGRVVPFR